MNTDKRHCIYIVNKLRCSQILKKENFEQFSVPQINHKFYYYTDNTKKEIKHRELHHIYIYIYIYEKATNIGQFENPTN